MDDIQTSSKPAKGNGRTLTRKHIAERQRRARINTYLEQLGQLTSSENKRVPVKLEKAEVLERTVEYLQNLKQTKNLGTDSSLQYNSGFKDCMDTVFGYLQSSETIYPDSDGLRQYLLRQMINRTNQIREQDVARQLSHPTQSTPVTLPSTPGQCTTLANVYLRQQLIAVNNLRDYSDLSISEGKEQRPLDSRVSRLEYRSSSPTEYFSDKIVRRELDYFSTCATDSTDDGSLMSPITPFGQQEQYGSDLDDRKSPVWRPW